MTEEENKTANNSANDHCKDPPVGGEFTMMTLLNKLQISTRCVKHPDQAVKFYCGKHDNFYCDDCASQIHNACMNTENIEANYSQLIRKNDVKKIKDWLDFVDKTLEEGASRIKNVKQKVHDFLSNAKAIYANKKKQRIELQEVQKKIESNQEKIIQVLGIRDVALQNLKHNLQECLQIVENDTFSPVLSVIARHQVFSLTQCQVEESLKILSTDIPEIEMSIQEQKILNIFSRIRFKVSIQYKKADVIEFVSICHTTMTQLFMHLINKSTAQVAINTLISCDITCVASKEKDRSNIPDCTPDATNLHDNTILLSDWSNNQLIKLDDNLCILERLPVAGRPWGVCLSSNGNIVHVICDENKVVSYKLQGHWKEIQRFDVESGAWGITCYGDRIVTGHWKCVVIYDSKGIEITKVETLGSSFYPAFSRDGRMLYHGDGDKSLVCRCMDDITKVVWRYLSEDLCMPRGIDTDRDGNILIVGWFTLNIHQVSEDGKLNRIIDTKMKNIKVPRGLFSNRKNNTFGVTSGGESKVCVELYKFED